MFIPIPFLPFRQSFIHSQRITAHPKTERMIRAKNMIPKRVIVMYNFVLQI